MMATANLSGNAKQKTVEQLFCPENLTAAAEIHSQLSFLSVLNIFLSVTSFLGNALILAALRKESSLHPPSKLLLRCLTTTDLCVGLIAEPLAVAYWMSLLNGHWNICPYASAASMISCIILSGVSLLTMTAISVDRLLALLLGLRYRQFVTLKRTYMTVVVVWALPTAITTTTYFWNSFITLWLILITVSLCLVTSIISFTKIFLTLRHHQAQLQVQPQQPNKTSPLNIAKYKKAVSSAIWLQLAMVACYLPQGLVAALFPYSGLSSSVFLAFQYAATLVLLNSSLNPILYCWKMQEVRQAVKDIIRQLLCRSTSAVVEFYHPQFLTLRLSLRRSQNAF